MITSDTFLQAHRAAFANFEATRNNIRLLRDSADFVGAAGQFAELDTKTLQQRLSYEAADGKHYCVVGEVVPSEGFVPSTLREIYELNARIILVNTAIRALKGLAKRRGVIAGIGRLLGRGSRQAPLSAAEVKALLSSQLDEILLRSRALAELFWYILKIAAQPLVVRRIVDLAGFGQDEPLSSAQMSEVDQFLRALLVQYKTRRGRAAGEIMSACLKPESMSERVSKMHVTLIPAWMDYPDRADARIVNDVWLPPEFAARVVNPASAARAAAPEYAETG
jgi:hypothetical protein